MAEKYVKDNNKQYAGFHAYSFHCDREIHFSSSQIFKQNFLQSHSTVKYWLRRCGQSVLLQNNYVKNNYFAGLICVFLYISGCCKHENWHSYFIANDILFNKHIHI